MPRRSRFVALAVCFVLSAAFAVVQAAPAAGPVLKISTDHKDAVYAKGETATFTISLSDQGQPVQKAKVQCLLSTDGYWHSDKRTVSITDGKGELTASRDKPCVLWLRVIYRPAEGKAVRKEGGCAFSPTEIKPSMPAPADFDQFWAEQKKRVDAIPPNAKLTPMKCDVPNTEFYSITMDNVNGTKIYGYFTKPKGDGPFPALLQVQWAGVYSLDPNWIKWLPSQGIMALDINAHAIENGKPKSYYQDLNNGRLNHYPYIGRDSRDTCYFLRMYLSCYQAAEYLAHRPDWDGKHLIVEGGSQGGGQTLVTAALDPHITAAAADVPAMCDHTARVVGRVPGWPFLVAMENGKPNPKQLQVSRYFDAVNFAREIHVPIIVGTGFADRTCASSSVYAAFNVIPSRDKRMILDPQTGHTGAHPRYYAAYARFLQQQSHSRPN